MIQFDLKSISNYFIDIIKIIPVITSILAFIPFVIKQMFVYYYACEYESKTGVPYFRYKINFSKSLIETFYYIVILAIVLAYQYFALINSFKLNIVLRAVIFYIFNFFYNILVLSPYNKFKLKIHLIVSLVISALITIGVMIAVTNFPLTKYSYTLFEEIKIIYSIIVSLLSFLFAIIIFLISTIKFFDNSMSLSQLKFEILRINNVYYAIVSKEKDEIVLVKLKKRNKKFYLIKSDYIIISSIDNRKLQYIKIEFE